MGGLGAGRVGCRTSGPGLGLRGPDRAGRATLPPPAPAGQIQRVHLPSEGPRERLRPRGKPRPGTGEQGAPSRPRATRGRLCARAQWRRAGRPLRGAGALGVCALRATGFVPAPRAPPGGALPQQRPFSRRRSAASAREPSAPDPQRGQGRALNADGVREAAPARLGRGAGSGGGAGAPHLPPRGAGGLRGREHQECGVRSAMSSRSEKCRGGCDRACQDPARPGPQ